MSAKAM